MSSSKVNYSYIPVYMLRSSVLANCPLGDIDSLRGQHLVAPCGNVSVQIIDGKNAFEEQS